MNDEPPSSGAPTPRSWLDRLGQMLSSDPRNRDDCLPCIALLIKRGEAETLLPENDEILERGDRILFCGRFGAGRQMEWIAKNHNVFDYLYSGEERASGSFWRWLMREKDHPASAEDRSPGC